MIRTPPISTLFPTRRSSDLINSLGALHELGQTPRPDRSGVRACCYCLRDGQPKDGTCNRLHAGHRRQYHGRSEEHTSELQSLRHLVCRLLLEKKKNSKITHTIATSQDTTTNSTRNPSVNSRAKLSSHSRRLRQKPS